jgi:hypothetical protein
VKIVKAFSWQDKLEQFAQDISELKDLLKVKLLLIINALAGETNAIVTASDAKMDEILKLLRRRTNAEADLSKYIDSRGGIETIVNDDKLMYRLVSHVEGRSDSGPSFAPTYAPAGYGTGRARAAAYSSAAQYYGPTSMYPNPPQPTRVPPPDGLYYDAPPAIATPFPSFARVGRGSRRPTRAPELYGNLYTYNEEPAGGGEQSLTVQLYKEEIQSALSTDLSVMLRRNEEIWTFKLDHFSGTIMRHFDVGTDRVLKAITEGPHTGIEHPELRAIWEQEVRGLFVFSFFEFDFTVCMNSCKLEYVRRNGEDLSVECSSCKRSKISCRRKIRCNSPRLGLRAGQSIFSPCHTEWRSFKNSIEMRAGL